MQRQAGCLRCWCHWERAAPWYGLGIPKSSIYRSTFHHQQPRVYLCTKVTLEVILQSFPANSIDLRKARLGTAA